MRHLTIALAALLWLAAVTPAHAATGGATLPPLAPLRSVRDSFVQSFNGQPLQVCESEWESWNRMHGTCHDLATATTSTQQLVAGSVVEFVVYDGTRYQRVNDSPTWVASRDERYDPDQTLSEALFKVGYAATLTQVGPASVAGVATTHYQYWSRDEALNARSGGQAVYDLFLSADGRVVCDSFSARGSLAGLGQGSLDQTWVYRDFNAAIVVAPPPVEQVRFGGPGGA